MGIRILRLPWGSTLAAAALYKDRPAERHATNSHARRIRRNVPRRAILDRRKQRDDRRLHVHMLGKRHEYGGEEREDGDRGLTSRDLRLAKVEPGGRKDREDDIALCERPPTGTRDRSEQADEPASTRSERLSGRSGNRGQIGRERLEIRLRACPISERRPLRKLLERQPAVGRRFPQSLRSASEARFSSSLIRAASCSCALRRPPVPRRSRAPPASSLRRESRCSLRAPARAGATPSRLRRGTRRSRRAARASASRRGKPPRPRPPRFPPERPSPAARRAAPVARAGRPRPRIPRQPPPSPRATPPRARAAARSAVRLRRRTRARHGSLRTRTHRDRSGGRASRRRGRRPASPPVPRSPRRPARCVPRPRRPSCVDNRPVEASGRTQHARELFAPLGPTYDRYARLLSFGQDPRWRSFLVSRIPPDASRVLDVASGTAAVAIELARAEAGRTITGVDQSSEMLAAGRARVERAGLSDRIELREAHAEALPFGDAEFDALTFTYLFRYVDDVPATLRELVRVVRPGGTVAMLEFGLPRGAWRPLWELYVRAGLPSA